jgi:hypothetical protein
MDNYHAHEDHPLVVLLMEYLNKSQDLSIPSVWEKYIKETKTETDMTLLITQLRVWGVGINVIDNDVRGEALFLAIRLKRFESVFDTVNEISRINRTQWPRAFEKYLEDQRVVPTKRDLASSNEANVSTLVDITYVETGTLDYTISRACPRQTALIPAVWVLENCAPERSDLEIMDAYHDGLETFFPVEGEKKFARGGFGLLDKIKQTLGVVEHFQVNTLSWDLSSAFPKEVVLPACHSDEGNLKVLLEHPKSDSFRTGSDVDRRVMGMRTPRSSRGVRRITKLRFPVFSREDRDSLSSRGYTTPSARTCYEGEMEGDTPGEFADALRNTYKRILRNKEYGEIRAKIRP